MRLRDGNLIEEKQAKELRKKIIQLTEKVEFYVLAICFILALNIFSAMFVGFADYLEQLRWLGFIFLFANILTIWLLGVSFVRDLGDFFIAREYQSAVDSMGFTNIGRLLNKPISIFYGCIWLVFGCSAVLFLLAKNMYEKERFFTFKSLSSLSVIAIIFFIHQDGRSAVFKVRNAIGAFVDTEIFYQEGAKNIDSFL